MTAYAVRRGGVLGVFDNPLLVQVARFVGVGVLNTTLDFLVFNFLTKQFNVVGGRDVVWVNAVSFSCAVVQSYYWNRNWIFGLDREQGLIRRFAKLFAIGVLGVGTFVAVLFGASRGFASPYYLLLLFGFLLIQLIVAHAFGLLKNAPVQKATGVVFGAFVVISVVGYFINSGIVIYGLEYLKHFNFGISQDLLKNLAKVLATFASLVWNFLGYKLVVFKTK